MKYIDMKEAIIEAAKRANLSEYEIYYSVKEDISTSAYLHDLSGVSSATSGGICFRCIVDGKMGYASTELFSQEEAIRIVENAMENAKFIECDDEVFIYDKKEVYESVDNRVNEGSSIETLKEKTLEVQEKLYSLDERIVDGTQTESFSSKIKVSLYNSNGIDVENEMVLEGLAAAAILPRGEEMVDDFSLKLDFLSNIDLDEVAKEAVDGAIEKLCPGEVESGTYEVVLSGKVLGALLDTFSSVFSAASAQRGLSLLKGKEGEQVASLPVTLVDDPFYIECTAKRPFDDEGVPTHKKDVIKDGVLVTLLHNLSTAKKDGVTTTGNGSKANYNSNVSVKPYYLYLEPGTTSQKDLFKIVEDGLYITELQGMHAGANPNTGDFSLAACGNRIVNGEKKEYIKGFTVAGNFYTLLKDIISVGNDLKFSYSGDLSNYGSPSVIVKELSVAGK